MSNDGEKIIQYFTTSKLRENCHRFLSYGTADIDNMDLNFNRIELYENQNLRNYVLLSPSN